jgi:hypothetical protein
MQLVIAIRKLLKLIEELVNIITTEVYYIYAYQKKDLALQDFNKAIELNDSISFFYNNRGLYWSGVNECN